MNINNNNDVPYTIIYAIIFKSFQLLHAKIQLVFFFFFIFKFYLLPKLVCFMFIGITYGHMN